MPVAHRSLRLTAVDMARIDALRDRCGPRATASEAVRAAIAAFLARAPLEDVTARADQLAAEAEAPDPGWTIWGISLQDKEATALDDVVAEPPAGVRRKFSRNEMVRLAVLLFADAPDDEVRATYAAVPRLARGRPKKVV